MPMRPDPSGRSCFTHTQEHTGLAKSAGRLERRRGNTLSSALDRRPANVSPSDVPGRGESTGGGVEGSLGGYDGEGAQGKQGTQTDMLRPRRAAGGGEGCRRRRRGVEM